MLYHRVFVVAIGLLLTFPTFSQRTESVATAPAAKHSAIDVRDSLAQTLLTEAFGTLQPGIMTLLADSGASKNRQKTGRWNHYHCQPCSTCPATPLRYDSLVQWSTHDPGSVLLLKETGLYQEGKREGVWHQYESYRISPPFGWSLVREVMYRDDKQNGWQITYGYVPPDSVLGLLTPRQYISGKRYLENDIARGPMFEFNESGDTVVLGQLVNGHEQGMFHYRYDTMATGRFDRVYENGRQIETIYYHRNGNVASRGLFIDHNPHGIFRSYNEGGMLVLEQTYKAGILDGPSHYFYEDGKRMMSETFVNGESNGRRVRYHRNGQISDEVAMHDNKPWTALSCFDPQGKEKRKGTLKNGTGSLKLYNDAGQLVAIEFYQEGDLLETQQR
ncbi:toxin-antitoxin system YwqK family antitoxin [Fulvivirgaceae bacterium PWU5]|uniref:Toxin-antitoxin system YwqK family antitoxin n=1 Tax=Dawidia cretensis TaxID=2782350 RepID=A0AAP2E0C9_9BACT|nr:toxin-antitoxin system YwqK family antitoxin [Dawidia cretensis]MBT1709704.1 toxin-antitoxin system YwqK family antitoxin [Dawidia cretensis]